MGFGGSVGVKLSGSSKDAMEFFGSGEGVMMISQATCMLHKVKINQVSILTDFEAFSKTIKAILLKPLHEFDYSRFFGLSFTSDL